MMRSQGQTRLLRIALAAALLPAATGAGAQAIGRLFNTPAERGQLDSVRNAASPAGAQTAVPTAPGIAPPGASQQIPYPGAGQPAAAAGAGQQLPYPGAGQQVPYPGGGQQAPYPGADQQVPYPGAGQAAPYPGGSQPVPYPGGNQAGNQPMPYPSGNPGANPGATPGDPPPPPPPPETLVMNGVLRTSSGRSTVWLNDVAQSGQQLKVVQRARSAPQLTVQLPSGKKVLLKPGQRYDLAEGRVKDVNEP